MIAFAHKTGRAGSYPRIDLFEFALRRRKVGYGKFIKLIGEFTAEFEALEDGTQALDKGLAKVNDTRTVESEHFEGTLSA